MAESKNKYKVEEQLSIVAEPSKNKYGQYFTPKIIADFMINLADIDVHSRILEPSCGKGVFLELFEQKNYKNIFFTNFQHAISHSLLPSNRASLKLIIFLQTPGHWAW